MLSYAHTAGPVSSPTLILLHPAGESRHAWTPHVERLTPDYRVVTVDLPGHGRHPDASFSFERAVDDVGHILDEAGPAVLAGHSQGGYVAIRAAAAHADRVDGLVLAGSAYDWRAPRMLVLSAAFVPLSVLLGAASHVGPLCGRYEARFEDRSPAQTPPPDVDTRPELRGTATAMRATAFQDTWPLVERYDGPVHLVHGTEEPAAEHVERLADRVDAAVDWLDGDHHRPVREPAPFTTVLRDFLGTVY